MQDQQKLFVEALKNAKSVLVTVGMSPSVDQLAATIGLSLALNKLDKHATAVFSGQVPSTLEFLKPENTLEKNTDSLRDFIIALDKSKADRLRYKVEDDVVRIFITPFHTAISEKDLDFSQGDFNVDLVVALGVDSLEDIDTAVKEHGRILHDAVVAALSTKQVADMGTVTWVAERASSLCEMVLVALQDVDPKLIDQQIATALLTGIVASTERFSNDRTTPITMNASASLMAAGANQQLITSQLATPVTSVVAESSIDDASPEAAVPTDLLGVISHDEPDEQPEPVAEEAITTPVPDPVSSPVQAEPPVAEQTPEESLTSDDGVSLRDDTKTEAVNTTEIRVDDDGRLRHANEETTVAESPADTSEPTIAVHRQLLTGHDQPSGFSADNEGELADPSLEPTTSDEYGAAMLSHARDIPVESSFAAPDAVPTDNLQDKYAAAVNAAIPADGVPKPPSAAVELPAVPDLPPVESGDDLQAIGLSDAASTAAEGVAPPPPVPPPLIPPAG